MQRSTTGRPSPRAALRAGALWLALALALLLGSAITAHAKKVLQDGGGADPEVEERLDDAKDELPNSPPPSGGGATATIRGSVFYNDQRTTDGLWSERFYPDGTQGKQCDASVNVPDCSAIEARLADLRAQRDEQARAVAMLQGPAKERAQLWLDELDQQVAAEEAALATCKKRCGLNWLGGRYMVVDVIERDDGFAITDTNCKREDVIASATVGRDGAFVATFPVADACRHDDLGTAVELRVRLRFCSDRYCFSINKDKNEPYALSHPGASATKPLKVKAGDDITVTRMNFNTGGDPLAPNNDSIAANYYASIVDTILKLHRDNPIPFYQAEYGELQYIFPSTKSSTATARSPTEVAISTFQSRPPELNGAYAWISGKTPAHEYSHVMMQRAWGGSYGFDGVGNGDPDPDNAAAPSVQIAFKEAWAEFIARVVFAPTRGCERPSFDANDGKAADANLEGPLGEGAQWRDNVVKALCDWYDETVDDDPKLAGPGDRFAAEDIHSMWSNLRGMYTKADRYGGEFKKPGLWFCDYVRYYLEVRKSAAAVGASEHASLEKAVRDLLYNNNIACNMPAPG
jgi:hypothetical protein